MNSESEGDSHCFDQCYTVHFNRSHDMADKRIKFSAIVSAVRRKFIIQLEIDCLKKYFLLIL